MIRSFERGLKQSVTQRLEEPEAPAGSMSAFHSMVTFRLQAHAKRPRTTETRA
jgi:hypothetical protein